LLDGSYRIERVIRLGWLGITYEAEDVKLGTKVRDQRVLPADFGQRIVGLSVRPTQRNDHTFEWGRVSFLRRRARLPFPAQSVVQVTRGVQANSTATW